MGKVSEKAMQEALNVWEFGGVRLPGVGMAGAFTHPAFQFR